MHQNMVALAGPVVREPIVNLIRAALSGQIAECVFEPLQVPEPYIPHTHKVVGTVGNTSLVIRELLRALRPHKARCRMVISALEGQEDADSTFVR